MRGFETTDFDVLASTSNFYVGASTDLIKYKTDLAKSEPITASDARQVVAVDISSLSGAHYIGGNNKGDKTTNVQIYNIYAS